MKKKPRLHFENLSEKHLDTLVQWIKRPHVAEWWGDESRLADEDLKILYQNYIKSNENLAFIISLEGLPIGFIQAYDASKHAGNWWAEEDDSFGTYLFIGEPDCLGKGYGTQIVAEFIDKLFIEHHARLLIIDPDPANIRAIRCYEKAGFTPIGLRKTPEGVHLLMELFRETWGQNNNNRQPEA